MSPQRDRTPPERARPERLRRIIAHYQRELPAVRSRAEALFGEIARCPGITARALLLAQQGARSMRTGTVEWKRATELLANERVVAFCSFCNAASESSGAPAYCEIEHAIGECKASGGRGA